MSRCRGSALAVLIGTLIATAGTVRAERVLYWSDKDAVKIQRLALDGGGDISPDGISSG